MIDLQRPILLSLPGVAEPSGTVRTGAAEAAVRRVDPVPGAKARDGGTVWSGWRHVDAEDGETEEAGSVGRGRARVGGQPAAQDRTERTAHRNQDLWQPEVEDDAAEPTQFGVVLGQIAFVAQQIYQEAMPAGLHREPWAEGIVAYRRAGAEPALETGDAVFVSIAV